MALADWRITTDMDENHIESIKVARGPNLCHNFKFGFYSSFNKLLWCTVCSCIGSFWHDFIAWPISLNSSQFKSFKRVSTVVLYSSICSLSMTGWLVFRHALARLNPPHPWKQCCDVSASSCDSVVVRSATYLPAAVYTLPVVGSLQKFLSVFFSIVQLMCEWYVKWCEWSAHV